MCVGNTVNPSTFWLKWVLFFQKKHHNFVKTYVPTSQVAQWALKNFERSIFSFVIFIVLVKVTLPIHSPYTTVVGYREIDKSHAHTNILSTFSLSDFEDQVQILFSKAIFFKTDHCSMFIPSIAWGRSSCPPIDDVFSSDVKYVETFVPCRHFQFGSSSAATLLSFRLILSLLVCKHGVYGFLQSLDI